MEKGGEWVGEREEGWGGGQRLGNQPKMVQNEKIGIRNLYGHK